MSFHVGFKDFFATGAIRHIELQHPGLAPQGFDFDLHRLRLGTPAVTTRGMVEADMEEIAAFIDVVLHAVGTERQDGVVAETKERVVRFMARFPLPYKL